VAVDHPGARLESPLRRTYKDRLAREKSIEIICGSMNRVALWHCSKLRDYLAGLFIGGNFADAANVALIVTERLGNK
jgi:hypothetical protein